MLFRSFLFLSAPNLRVAFAGANDFLATVQGTTRSHFFEGDGLATYEYAILDQSLSNRAQDAEFSLATVHNLCQTYVGSDFELVEVRFEHSCLSNPKVYRDFFGCDVYFEHDVNSISFDVRLLEKSGTALDPALFPIILDHVKRLANRVGASMSASEQARKVLSNSDFARPPRLQDVAGIMGISAATLNRRLRAEGSSWRDMLGQWRMEAAVRLLRQSRRDVADIALSVGFAESASFVRSFKRHYGTTPKRYREGSGLRIQS